MAAKTSVSTPLSPGLARHSFAKIREPLAVPDLLALQKASFDWLLGREDWRAKIAAEIAAGNTEIPQMSGLSEIFEEISPIEDLAGMMSLSFRDHRFEPSKYTVEQCKDKDFTWKARLDFDACIQCGRCDELCPPFNGKEPFSPQDFIQKLKQLAHGAKGENPEVVGNALDKDFVWYCRTCGGCVEACPAAIDHIDHFLLLRRDLLIMQGEIPSECRFKMSAHCGHGNPCSFRLLESIGANSLNPVRDIQLQMLSAIRQAIDIPIDVHTENPKSSGGFIRHYEVPEMIRVTSPIYLKTGGHVAQSHSWDTTLAQAKGRAKQIHLVNRVIEHYYPDAVCSPQGSID